MAPETPHNSIRQPNRHRILSVLLNLLGWGGGLFFLILVWKQAAAVEWAGISIDWATLAVSFVLLLIGLALQSQLAWVTQHYLGYPVERATIYRVWFFSQVAKYIPGSLWQIAARSMFYIRRGVPLGVASAATLWELVATVTGSLIVCLLSFTLKTTSYLLSLAALLLVILAIAFYMMWPWRLLTFFRIKLARRIIEALAQLGTARYRMVFTLLLLSVVVWLIIGTGFYFLAVAFGSNNQLSWWDAVISFNIAYSIGFLVILAPAGLGVREVVLSLLLAPFFSVPGLAVFVLVARFWWILGDGVHILVAGIGQLMSRRTEAVNDLGS